MNSAVLAALSKFSLIMLIVLGVLIIALVVMYIFGRRLQKKQDESREQMNAAAQPASILVIDKKKLRLKDAGLPAVVMQQAPRMAKLSKMPVVKAKVGPKVMTLLCDESVYKVIPVKKECKVTISGLYIMEILSARGGVEQPVKKKGLFGRLRAGSR